MAHGIVLEAAGNIFTETTEEGIEMTFMVISSSEKTCMVGVVDSDGEPIIKAIDKNTSGKITIPSNPQGYSVKAIAVHAFEGCSSITDIVIPDGVETVGRGAFGNCPKLETITIPNSVTFIDRDAFSGCTSLSLISLPDNITTISHGLFYNCSSLHNIKIPDNVTSIENQAFQGCSKLSTVLLPKKLTYIGSLAFVNCHAITDVYCNTEQVPSLSAYAFDSSTNSNATLHVPAALVEQFRSSDQWSNFSNIAAIKSSVTDYDFCGENVMFTYDEDTGTITIFGTGAMYDYNWANFGFRVRHNINIKNVIIEEGVTTVGMLAFYYCQDLVSVHLPNSLISIGIDAFSNCWNLSSINIPNNVISIGIAAFSGCWSLSSINIPSSVTFIGERAFRGCSGLTSISVDSGNLIYDSRDNCNALIHTATNELITGCVNTYIPYNVTSIASGAFSGCSGLSSIFIPNSVTSIARETFSGCSGLTSISVDSSNPIYDSRDNCNAIINTATNELIVGCKETVIPHSVTSIGNSAFYQMGLTSLTIPDGIISIGQGAFSGCDLMTSITIPSSVVSIGFQAFWYCVKLENIYCYAEQPPTTDGYAFTGVPQEAVLYVPMNSIDLYSSTEPWNRFSNIEGLADTPTEGDIVIKWDGIFYSLNTNSKTAAVCDKNKVEMTQSYQSTGSASDYLFIYIPSIVYHLDATYDVTSIEKEALLNRNDINDISIPSSVQSIGEKAFYGCELDNVFIDKTEPLDISDDVFDIFTFTHATLYVPYGSGAKYMAADGWKNFYYFVESGSSDVRPDTKIEVKDDTYYTIEGRKVQGRPTKKGVYIVNGKKVVIN